MPAADHRDHRLDRRGPERADRGGGGRQNRARLRVALPRGAGSSETEGRAGWVGG